MIIVYAGTRNIYRQMTVAAKSLLHNTPGADVWFLIEDDAFPERLPAQIHVRNVSGQEFFPENGPNYDTHWSYMTLMRCALAKLFPEEKQALWLDTDTIVDEDITELLETDLEGVCFAGCIEPLKTWRLFRYINAGVLLCNLEEIRRTGKDDELIRLINGKKMAYPDQDAINELCQGCMKTFGGEWNASLYTERGNGRKIIHYAAQGNREAEPEYRKYAAMGWPAVKEGKTCLTL